MNPKRGDVYLISLDPTRGKEIQKTRPYLIVSPDELNEHLSTCIVAPMTTGGHRYPFRLSCRFQGENGYVVLDQLRTVDRDRLIRNLGRLHHTVLSSVLNTLQEMFAQ